MTYLRVGFSLIDPETGTKVTPSLRNGKFVVDLIIPNADTIDHLTDDDALAFASDFQSATGHSLMKLAHRGVKPEPESRDTITNRYEMDLRHWIDTGNRIHGQATPESEPESRDTITNRYEMDLRRQLNTGKPVKSSRMYDAREDLGITDDEHERVMARLDVVRLSIGGEAYIQSRTHAATIPISRDGTASYVVPNDGEDRPVISFADMVIEMMSGEGVPA